MEPPSKTFNYYFNYVIVIPEFFDVIAIKLPSSDGWPSSSPPSVALDCVEAVRSHSLQI